MIRRRVGNYRLMAVLSLIVVMTACGRGCGRKPTNGGIGVLSSDSEAVFIEQPVSFCWQKPLEPKRGNVQVLVDSSGSMIGFEKTLPHLVTWVQQGISQLQGTTLIVENSRICQFSQGRGIYNCSDFSHLTTAYDHSGNTNLHEAIRAAQDFELTFILTDGVAATGSQGSSDCARGVDADCVAKALRDFVNPQSSKGDDVGRGLWIIPVMATYDGKFYTEEPIVPTNFQTKETIDRIRSDIGVEAVVQAPRTEADGLVFTYQGPRAMLLIVLARWADVGRAAVQAVWERASLNSIDRLEQIKGFSSRLGILKPLEVYPGFLNSVQWKTLQESDKPDERRGTMDVSFEGGSIRPLISLSCPKNGSGEGIYTLTGSPTTSGQVSGCVPIQLLPAFQFKFRSVRDEDDAELREVLIDSARQNGSYTDLRFHLACNPNSARNCGENPISAQWMAYMNYKKAADGLVSPAGEHSVQQQVRDMSTEHPSKEPHRIFAFAQTLESFYREVAEDQRSIILANMDFCHKQ